MTMMLNLFSIGALAILVGLVITAFVLESYKHKRIAVLVANGVGAVALILAFIEWWLT